MCWLTSLRRCHRSLDWFKGKFLTGNPWVFTIKYRVFHHPIFDCPSSNSTLNPIFDGIMGFLHGSCKFSHHPILFSLGPDLPRGHDVDAQLLGHGLHDIVGELRRFFHLPWRSLSHDGSMVLLYMVCHGSHQYTPFMLAYIYIPYMDPMGLWSKHLISFVYFW